MPLTEDSDIADVLRSTRSIALTGASHKPSRPSYEVLQFLLAQGYTVYPVNPHLAGRQLLGQTVYASLADLPHPVDMLDVFRSPEHLPEIVGEAIAHSVSVLWTQLGVVDDAAARRAELSGMRVVMDRCPKIELPRLARSGLLDARVPPGPNGPVE